MRRGGRRRLPKPSLGVQVYVGHFAGDEHPPALDVHPRRMVWPLDKHELGLGIAFLMMKLLPRAGYIDPQSSAYCNPGDCEIILCDMWSLWNSRNDRRHGKSPIESGLAVDWALDSCYHLSFGCSVSDQGRPAQEGWTARTEGTLKINVDGAFIQDNCVGAVGAVVRCSSGTFRVAATRWLSLVGSALLSEAEALRGVRLIPAGTQHVIVETDAQELASLWKNRGIHWSEAA